MTGLANPCQDTATLKLSTARENRDNPTQHKPSFWSLLLPSSWARLRFLIDQICHCKYHNPHQLSLSDGSLRQNISIYFSHVLFTIALANQPENTSNFLFENANGLPLITNCLERRALIPIDTFSWLDYVVNTVKPADDCRCEHRSGIEADALEFSPPTNTTISKQTSRSI